MNEAAKNPRLGYVCAILAQVIWGCFPIYLHFLRDIPASDIVAHRTIWSFALLFCLMLLSRLAPPSSLLTLGGTSTGTSFSLSRILLPLLPTVSEARATIGSSRKLIACLVAAILIAINWCVFVWAANNDYKVDASLGYYICPQVMVLLGVVFLGERLGLIQWIGVSIVAVGVMVMAQSGTGLVWISLSIAGSFGLYALCKKKTSMTALGGLTIETAILSVPAIAFLIYQSQNGSAFMSGPLTQNFLLLGCGLATISPLALYAVAVKHIPLSTMGFLQFIGPTLQFGLGVFVFDEPIDSVRFTGFTVVWIGIVLFLLSRRPAPNIEPKPITQE